VAVGPGVLEVHCQIETHPSSRNTYPGNLDGRSSRNIDVQPTGGSTLVAVDVAAAESGGLNESVVLVQRIPTSSLLPLVCRHVEPVWLGASREGASGSDTGDEAVGRRSVEKGGDGAE
jgi:hypothetical protein